MRSINSHIRRAFQGIDAVSEIIEFENQLVTGLVSHWNNDEINYRLSQLDEYRKLTPYFKFSIKKLLSKKKEIIYSFFSAKRQSTVEAVITPTKDSDFIEKINTPDSTQYFINKFKQFLVNKKVEQAFNIIDNQHNNNYEIDLFFENIRMPFRKIFEDEKLKINFIRNDYEFLIELSDKRSISFNDLSEGFSAFISILMDLFIRVDLIRKQVNDYTYNPCGIVLIDEPETHLHLELQYQILPLLTELFPNIQFIAATHSPAVISSIKHATIFDLTTKEAKNDEVAGRSYSDLMMTHFGLDNEYSNIADEIIKEVNDALKAFKNDKKVLKDKLSNILKDKGHYLSPVLRIELESMIIQYTQTV